MTTPDTQRRVVLARRPDGPPVEDDFRVETTGLPAPSTGEILVRTVHLSLDPYIRGSLTGRNLGHPAVHPDDLVPGRAVGQVVGTGAWVVAETGWQEYACVRETSVRPVRVPPGVPRSAVLGVLGVPGLTAYAAITRLLRPRVADTVVVSAGTGAVGGTAGQLARLAGARTVAVAGGPGKCATAAGLFGYHAAVDRHAPDWRDRLADACPDGVHGYLHMAGGEVLAGVLDRLAVGARVVLCGLPEHANETGRTTLPAGPLLRARASVHGLVVYDHEDLRPEFARRTADLVADGRLALLEEEHAGLASAPRAFCGLAAGRNHGKVVVHVGEEAGP